jgi:hypothetical protein
MNPGALLNLELRQTALLSMEPCVEEPPSIPRHSGSFLAARGHDGFAAEAAGILDDVRRTIERNPESARAGWRLVTFLTRSAEAGTAGARGGLAPWQSRKIERYLTENLDQSMYIDQVAGQVSLSVSHFCRAFKETSGLPHTCTSSGCGWSWRSG